MIVGARGCHVAYVRAVIVQIRGYRSLLHKGPVVYPGSLLKLRVLPAYCGLRMGLPGLEPGTSSLSEKRSNRLSYRPVCDGGIRRRVNVQHGGVADKLIEDRRGGQ